MHKIIMTASVTDFGDVAFHKTTTITVMQECGALMDLQMAAGARSNIMDHMYATHGDVYLDAEAYGDDEPLSASASASRWPRRAAIATGTFLLGAAAQAANAQLLMW